MWCLKGMGIEGGREGGRDGKERSTMRETGRVGCGWWLPAWFGEVSQMLGDGKVSISRVVESD